MRAPLLLVATVFLSTLLTQQAHGFSATAGQQLSVSKLLQQYAPNVKALQQEAVAQGASLDKAPYSCPVFFLRYCIIQDDDDSSSSSSLSLVKDQVASFRANMEWRNGAGKSICESAAEAVKAAQSFDSWKNAAVFDAAPHAAAISKFLTPANCITTTSNTNDLVYCIRAGQIDDVGLMEAVSVTELVDFFLYAKEVNSMVCNQRSEASDKLLQIVTANDLAGVKLIGGSATFRQALSESSKLAVDLYPGTAGPTLLLNLPMLLSALVKLFTPLFPEKINKKLKFAQGPLKNVESLTEIGQGGSGRAEFLTQMDDLVYSN